jgi:hypothetical protein
MKAKSERDDGKTSAVALCAMADKSARAYFARTTKAGQDGATVALYAAQEAPLYVFAKRTHRFLDGFLMQVVMNEGIA